MSFALENKLREALEENQKLRELTSSILLRIVAEQVPLFSSQRLRNLHKDCRELLDYLHPHSKEFDGVL